MAEVVLNGIAELIGQRKFQSPKHNLVGSDLNLQFNLFFIHHKLIPSINLCGFYLCTWVHGLNIRISQHCKSFYYYLVPLSMGPVVLFCSFHMFLPLRDKKRVSGSSRESISHSKTLSSLSETWDPILKSQVVHLTVLKKDLASKCCFFFFASNWLQQTG